MFDLLGYLQKQGKATQLTPFPSLNDAALGLPAIDASKPCSGTECSACVDICPTNAIKIADSQEKNAELLLDLGKCIGCGLCVATCPTELIVRNSSTKTATSHLEDLVISNLHPKAVSAKATKSNIFKQSLAVRVVSTGCSSCDAEINAAGNPIFDMERFGVSVVASPRMADALVVTGPVGKGMQDALIRTYEAMSEPRIVIACGTCAISGGVHANGYASANGVGAILPVDFYIPGCPPHPWSIAYGLMMAMGRV